MKLSRFIPATLALSCLSLPSREAHADIINITASNRGSLNANGSVSSGFGTASGNYGVGVSSTIPNANFFGFDLSSLTGQTISSAQLIVSRGIYNSPDASETYTLYDSNSTFPITNGGTSANRSTYTDLSSGISYGSFVVTNPGNTTASTDTFTIDLNSAAISAIQARNGGYFNIGGVLTSAGSTTTQLLFAGTQSSPYTTQLRVNATVAAVATPEPSTYAMMALGLVALCVLGAKRKKNEQAL